MENLLNKWAWRWGGLEEIQWSLQKGKGDRKGTFEYSTKFWKKFNFILFNEIVIKKIISTT